MLELFKTEDIDETNVIEAVQRINEAILTDPKSLKVLQTELAQRDEKLLKVLVDVKNEQVNMRQEQQKMCEEQKKMRQEQQKMCEEQKKMREEQTGMRKDLQELSSTMHEGFNELHSKYDQSIEILKQIALNTKK